MTRPLVLAGPILRRVERNRVAVWIALRDQATVRLKVWPGVHQAHPGEPGEIAESDPHPTREASAQTIRFGARLHVALVDLKLGARSEGDDPDNFIQPVLDPGAVYSYHLRITPAQGDITDLRGEGLLADRPSDDPESPQRPAGVPLGYATDQLPSFATCPSDVADLFLLQTSCRNAAPDAPNAGQDPERGADDLMTAYDPLIGDHLGDARTRPHQLFLTGDQIYADATAGPILGYLTTLAGELLGTDELIPLGGGEAFPLTVDNFPAGSREKLCVESARLTSSEASSHVIGLGEFYASHLVAWSEACWDGLTDELPSVDNSALRAKLTDWPTCISDLEARVQTTSGREQAKLKKALKKAREGLAEARKEFREQRQRIEGYRRNVPLVRRVLANVPSYMIFDDHEVTDDWNLTEEWRNRVLTTDLGSTILRNGLLAYGVFQGWGNDPGVWGEQEGEPGPNKALLDAASALFAGSTIDAQARDRIDVLLGHAGAGAKARWHYSIDFEAHRVVVLDTRTQRQLSLRHRPPGLLTATALNQQLPAGPLPPQLQVLIVVSPAPVLGPSASDHVIQPLGGLAVDIASTLRFDREPAPCTGRQLDPFEGHTKVDLESWFADDDAFEALLQRLVTYGDDPIVVLSGDVHYGLAAVLDYWKKPGPGDNATSRIVQFTASAARNVWPPELVHLLTFTRQFVPGQRLLLALKAPPERLAWVDDDPTPVAGAQAAARPLRSRLRTNPVLVPARGWPEDATEQRPPDWAWRLELVADGRSDDGTAADPRPEQVRAPPPPPFDPAEAVDGYAAAVARHAGAAADNVQLRTIVAEFNAGGLRFRRDDSGALIARGELYSRNHKRTPAPQAAANTVVEVPLAPTTADRPAIGV